MESSQENGLTPRRSQRLLKTRESTPEVEPVKKIRGPRSMLKYKKAKQVLEQHNKTAPEIIVTRPSLLKEKKEEDLTEKVPSASVQIESSKEEVAPKDIVENRDRTRREKSINSSEDKTLSKTSSLEHSSGVEEDTTVIEVEKAADAVSIENPKSDETHDTNSQLKSADFSGETLSKDFITEQIKVEDNLIYFEVPEKESEKDVNPNDENLLQQVKIEKTENLVDINNEDAEVKETDSKMIPKERPTSPQVATAPESWTRAVEASAETVSDLDVTPQLMDESIISVKDSPVVSVPLRDSTFSPIVDTSIQDSRPVIDVPIITPQSVALRTSTPYAKKIQKADDVVLDKVQNNLQSTLPLEGATPKRPVEGKKEKLNQTLNKSILKTTRKRRSMSVSCADSFMQKRVMFNSPKIMNIDAIDEKMMASFFEEKENSIMKKPPTSGRRQRSLSTGTPSKNDRPLQLRSKMPNFKAIHEQQFRKMESIADHAQRKANRAKQLGTPKRDETKKLEPSNFNQGVDNQLKKQQTSKIPTRSALVSSAVTENLFKGGNRMLKRSHSANTDDPQLKKLHIVSSNFTVGTSNTKKVDNSINITAIPSSSQSILQKNRSKVEERREKNISLFKFKGSRTDRRAQSVDILKGVRLNRRFELQMQHRRDVDKSE